MTKIGGHTGVNAAHTALAVLGGLGCLAGAIGCSSTAGPSAMPTEKHRMPTVLGPVTGSGSKSFTMTIRPGMAIELGCLGNAKDWAWARSSIASFSIPCGSAANEPFGDTYVAARDMQRGRFSPGERMTLRVSAPAGDTWQLWVTGAVAT
ncbi:MAG TPA: hypothetical protein VMI73_23705 [Trebonia sp.]|nr:hypothetical protein [Trebonia sp.]